MTFESWKETLSFISMLTWGMHTLEFHSQGEVFIWPWFICRLLSWRVQICINSGFAQLFPSIYSSLQRITKSNESACSASTGGLWCACRARFSCWSLCRYRLSYCLFERIGYFTGLGAKPNRVLLCCKSWSCRMYLSQWNCQALDELGTFC